MTIQSYITSIIPITLLATLACAPGPIDPDDGAFESSSETSESGTSETESSSDTGSSESSETESTETDSSTSETDSSDSDSESDSTSDTDTETTGEPDWSTVCCTCDQTSPYFTCATHLGSMEACEAWSAASGEMTWWTECYPLDGGGWECMDLFCPLLP